MFKRRTIKLRGEAITTSTTRDLDCTLKLLTRFYNQPTMSENKNNCLYTELIVCNIRLLSESRITRTVRDDCREDLLSRMWIYYTEGYYIRGSSQRMIISRGHIQRRDLLYTP